MRPRSTFGVALASCITAIRCETSFLQPPAAGPLRNYRDNPNYEVGERIDVQWTSDIDFMDLILWQDYPMASETDSWFFKLQDNTRSTSLIWPVSFDGFSTDLNDGEDAVFYFAVYENGIDVIVSTSHYFNVTFEKAKETTTTTKQPDKADPTSTTSETATSTAEPTTTETGPADPSSDNGGSGGGSGLSTGAVAGIAVGATLGGIALLAGLGFLAWRHLRNRGSSEKGQYAEAPTNPPAPTPPGGYYKPPESQSSPSQPRSELGGTTWVHPPQAHPNTQNVGGLHEAP